MYVHSIHYKLCIWLSFTCSNSIKDVYSAVDSLNVNIQWHSKESCILLFLQGCFFLKNNFFFFFLPISLLITHIHLVVLHELCWILNNLVMFWMILFLWSNANSLFLVLEHVYVEIYQFYIKENVIYWNQKKSFN